MLSSHLAKTWLGGVMRVSVRSEHWAWSLVTPSPPPGAYRLTHIVISWSLFPLTHPLPSSPLSPPAVGTLVRRVSFRKEGSMFRPQADTESLITPEPSATLPADMKQISSWRLSLGTGHPNTNTGGLEWKGTQHSPSATEGVAWSFRLYTLQKLLW